MKSKTIPFVARNKHFFKKRQYGSEEIIDAKGILACLGSLRACTVPLKSKLPLTTYMRISSCVVRLSSRETRIASRETQNERW